MAKELSNNQAPLQAINELLAISNIPIKITLGKDEQLFASKNGSEPYSIAELSDSERNALLIGADVLTTEPNTLIILDEPERHLHRSIIARQFHFPNLACLCRLSLIREFGQPARRIVVGLWTLNYLVSANKTMNPAWRKWSSVVKASVILFSVITTNEVQSVNPQFLSGRCP